MTASVSFTVPGVARGKGRPRATIRGGHASVYTDSKTAAYENLIALSAKAAMGARALLEGPVEVEMLVWFAIPGGASKKARAGMLSGVLRPTKKPDVDNIAKCLDALNGIVFADDKQIVRLFITKHYAAAPQLDVIVSELDTNP